jgi:hypothetical protein
MLNREHMPKILPLKILPLIGIIAAAGALNAQHLTTLATGLKNPAKIIRIASGSLLVTETDTAPNSGRVTRITSGGLVHPVIAGLPSGLSAPNSDPDGPSGIILAGRVLYVEIGEGDGFANGPQQGQLIANPKGISSPIFASILKFTLNADVDQIVGTFTLTAQDQSNLSLGNTVSLNDGSGSTASCEIVTQFRPGVPDPNSIWRNSHPYAMTSLDSQPGVLYAADAGRNIVWQVDAASGKTKAVTQFSPTPNPVAGPPVIEPVPDSIQPYNGQLLVTLLSGAPFVGGQSRVVLVDPATGTQSLFIALLTSAIDVGFVPQPGARPVFYVLQYSSSLATGGPGQLVRYDTTAGRVYVDNLKGPSSMAIDTSTGTVFVAERSAGDILAVAP